MSSRWLQPPVAQEIGATVLRTINPQLTLWESILPQCCLGLPGDLAEIDELLDDERFFEPFRPFFDPVMGRPSIPIETYLRMMFLKYRYRLGYEPLCRRWPTPSPGAASVGCPSTRRCRIRPR
jgi:IS5 family transposase